MFQENVCLKIFAVVLFCCDKYEKTTIKKVSGRQSYVNLTLGNFDLVSDPFCLHKIEGPIEKFFGSDDGFALFLNGMGFNIRVLPG